MHDADVHFRDDAEIEVQQMIVVLMHRAVKRIFDGDDRRVDPSVPQGGEDVFKAHARLNYDCRAEEEPGGFVAECAGFALNGRPQGLGGSLHAPSFFGSQR